MFPKTGRGLTTNPKVNLVQVQEKRRREKEKRMANKIKSQECMGFLSILTTSVQCLSISLFDNPVFPFLIHPLLTMT